MPLPAKARRDRRAYNKLHNSVPAKPVIKKKRRRKRCDNCNELTEMTQDNKRFCSDQCRKEYHQNGGAFGPLKLRLEKLVAKITKQTREQLLLQIDQIAGVSIKLVGRVAELEGELARVEQNHALDVRALRDEIRMESDRAS